MRFFFAAIFLLTSTVTWCQEEIALYEKIPNAIPGPNQEKQEKTNNGWVIISKTSVPTIRVYLPPADKATGTAVVICPGGGYSVLASTHEGTDVARQLNEWGIAAFVLKYRLPDSTIMIDRSIGPLQDAQRAIQLVREKAGEWHIDPNKIGIMGFSAGGHLASTAGTHFNHPVISTKNKPSVRPDFMVLVYPVISFTDSLTHTWSRYRLIGNPASPKKIRLYSNELQVTKKTPPSFLVHAKDDDVVKFGNATVFQAALNKRKIPNELIVYEKGGHGFGMNNPTSTDKWMDHLHEWLTRMKF